MPQSRGLEWLTSRIDVNAEAVWVAAAAQRIAGLEIPAVTQTEAGAVPRAL